MWSAKALISGLALVVAISAAAVAAPPPGATDRFIFRLEAQGATTTTVGHCVLVQQGSTVERPRDFYFLTAGQLLREARDDRNRSFRVRIAISDVHVLEATANNVLFTDPSRDGVDLAIIRVTGVAAHVTAAPIILEPPSVGDVFMSRGAHGDSITGRVGFRSASRIVSDRTTQRVGELLGAPALAEHGMFGIVTDGSATGFPIITLMTAAREFLSRIVPGWQPAAAPLPMFDVQHRVIETPLQDACRDSDTVDIDVPVALRSGELIVDAKPLGNRPSGVLTGELTMVSFDEHAVKLRFTMPAETSHTTPPCGPGQPLVTIGVDVLVTSRPAR